MFTCKTLADVRAAAESAGVNLPVSENLDVLSQPLTVRGHVIPNRIAIQPMEGCDGTPDGSPGELTLRRYDRFARSGAGLIWFEACATSEEVRANPRQAWLKESNLDAYKRLADGIRETAMATVGYAPLLIMQSTHSGRYSKPHGVPAPIIAYNNPIFEKDNPLPKECIATDDHIRKSEDDIARTAQLAQKAGFDGLDVKACHRYLGSELLSAYDRQGEYGGSFENRTRFLINGIKKTRAAVDNDFIVTSRLNIYDGFPYPYGFGVAQGGGVVPDMTEPSRLLNILHQDLGVEMVDITIGNPYVNPHVNRPADMQSYPLPEDPFVGVARMIDCIAAVKKQNPTLTIIGSALSYLRAFSGNLAAGAIEQGIYDMAGFGRMAFAYPDFARDLLEKGQLAANRCCVSCGKCSQLMRMGSTAGCVVRDATYTKLYKELTKK